MPARMTRQIQFFWLAASHVAPLMTDTVPELPLATYIVLVAASTATPSGRCPTVTVAITQLLWVDVLQVAASITDTVPSPVLVT